jgi:membrane associated rhomboid family serine protease
MSTHRLTRVAERIGEAIVDHRLASFLLTSVTLVLMTDAIRRVLPDETAIDGLTWTLLALMAFAVIVSILVPALLPQDRRAFVGLVIGVSPAIYGFAGALAGSPPLLMWVGTPIALCLVASCLVGTPRGQWEPY